jgi:hypothetical protein
LKKIPISKGNIQPTMRKIRKISSTGPHRRYKRGKGKILRAALSSKGRVKTKNLSIHFPEGAVITLKFRLTQPETGSQTYDQDTYQLTDICLGLEMVKLDSEAIDLIKNELKSVSLRHTS